jgi:hypothetical protein
MFAITLNAMSSKRMLPSGMGVRPCSVWCKCWHVRRRDSQDIRCLQGADKDLSYVCGDLPGATADIWCLATE